MAPTIGSNEGGSSLGPLLAGAVLRAREVSKTQLDEEPGHGAVDPHNISNNAMFALFGLIGAAFVVVGIWFFFWAKNGGFYFKQEDWDDYKSTVLRRKGPNGTILSGATPSTILGGGSVYKDVDDGTTEDGATTITASSAALTGITGGVSDFAGREKRSRARAKKERKEREKERRRAEKEEGGAAASKSKRRVGADGVLVDEEAEAEAKEHLRSYRHEKAARVGGINKESEGSQWDGSTNPSQSEVTSDLMSNRERTPTSTPTKSEAAKSQAASAAAPSSAPGGGRGGIRKVYSTADKTADREEARIRAEARRLQEKGRAAKRRDFSFQRGGDDNSQLRRIDEAASTVPSDASSDVGTKSYRHVIPGLSAASESGSSSYTAERRKQRRAQRGYRRGAGDEIAEE